MTSIRSDGRITIIRPDAARPAVQRVILAGDYLPAGLPGRDSPTECATKAEGLRSWFEDSALTVVNLECPVAVDGLAPVAKPGGGDAMGAPSASLAYLKALGVDVAGLANNHTYDFGEAGLERTKAALDKLGVMCVGAGRTTATEPEVAVVGAPAGPRVGVWNAANATLRTATQSATGAEPLGLSRGRQALDVLARSGADVRIAFLHAGVEGTSRPDPADKKLLEELAKAGFDVVAACHSHRASGCLELAREDGSTALCLFGLGSLSSSVAYSELDREGIVAMIGIGADGGLVEAEARPVWLDDSGWGSRPTAERAEALAHRFVALSEEIREGSFSKAFYADVSGGFLKRQLRDTARAYRNAGLRGLAAKARRARIKHLRRLIFRFVPGNRNGA